MMKYRSFLQKQQQQAISLGKEEAAAFFYLLYVTGLSSSELYTRINENISNEEIARFEEGFSKYLYDNVPIQYLIKSQTFFGYDFYVDERVLIPRFETEELVENVLSLYDEYFAGKKVKVCDIGTGSGAIAISLAKEEKNMSVIATDISQDALDVALINNERLNAGVEFRLGNMVEPLLNSKFDIVVSNPPYIPEGENVASLVKDNEPNIALFGGEDGLYFYRIILANVGPILNDKAIIAFEHGYDKNEAIERLARQFFPQASIIHRKDMQGKDRMSFILVGDFSV